MLGIYRGRMFTFLLLVAIISFHLDSLTTGASLGEHCPVNEILIQLATFHFFSAVTA